jgi:phosphate uptake regulator
VADHANKVAEGVLRIEGQVSQQIVDRIVKMSEYAVGLFEEAGLALFKSDYHSADEVVENAKEAARMEEEILTLIAKGKDGEQDEFLPLIVEDIRRTAEYAADIAEVVINMNTEGAMTATEDGPLLKAV